MDPLSWFVTPIFTDVGRSAAYTIDERAAHMTEFDDVEDTSLDLYAAVRNGYPTATNEVYPGWYSRSVAGMHTQTFRRYCGLTFCLFRNAIDSGAQEAKQDDP